VPLRSSRKATNSSSSSSNLLPAVVAEQDRESTVGRVDLRVEAPYTPAGDQPKAIATIASAIGRGEQRVLLHGITGSGKSATLAWVVERLQRPALVLAPNKSLAAQLHAELSALLPDNAVEYFVSYYDYYQPEAYVPASDTFIEKEATVNETIDKMRHAATAAALTRNDVVVVASVSALYGLGSPTNYRTRSVQLSTQDRYSPMQIAARLVAIGYDRNDIALERGRFRLRGDTLDIHPADSDTLLRVRFYGDDIETLEHIDPVTHERVATLEHAAVFPASHHIAVEDDIEQVCVEIETELGERLAELGNEGKLLEAARLRQRVGNDIESLRETGRCRGVENYSRYFDKRDSGTPPHTLLDYFDNNVVVFLDESHVLVPQLASQQAGDRSRKDTLVEHGFRLPSALDNRPLSHTEFFDKVETCVFISATPGMYEQEVSTTVAELVVRPTGILDPVVHVRPTAGAVDDMIDEVRDVAALGQASLVTVLTKQMAEDLCDHLVGNGVAARYMHSDTTTFDRIDLLRDLRLGQYSVLVGINLLREGLDLPEVSRVFVFDADREGFLRSQTALVQTIGRAARHIDGQVVLYGDNITPAMERAIDVTRQRRQRQETFNAEHGIVPTSVSSRQTPQRTADKAPLGQSGTSTDELERRTVELEALMLAAAEALRFEDAARLRDELEQVIAHLDRLAGGV
jgi:excinuclease ABC subunit B